ncbi:SGNH/GDSL hydrolase family protein [Bacillota bacterium Lsc_1132]
MKYFLTASLAVVSIVVLFFGHSYWKERTAVKADAVDTPVVAEAAAPKASQASDFVQLTKNWPVAAQKQFAQSVKAKKTFTILFVGSRADRSSAQAVAAKLEETFGKKLVKTAVQTSDLTSTEFVAQKKSLEMASEQAQLIIFEPFLLNDNGKVETKTALANLSKVIESVKAVNPGTTFILQPSYPLFAAKFYPLQVDALKKYAQDNGIAYLDHWKAWPDYQKEELKNYLLADQSAPNDKGNGVWAKFLEDYLISK